MAQVLGATDPISGTATLLEIVRGLGHLVKKGWKPLRTILIASWDAEEVPSTLRMLHSSANVTASSQSMV